MYKRQQNDILEELKGFVTSPEMEQYIQGLLVNPIIHEQLNLPIIQLAIRLRQGRTQKVAIRTPDGFYISPVGGVGGNIIANATTIGPNEIFNLVPQGIYRDKVAIQTSKGYYLSAVDGGGRRVTTSTTIGPNEHFRIIPINPDKAIFITDIGFFLIPLATESRLLTAYSIAADMRNIFTIVPQS